MGSISAGTVRTARVIFQNLVAKLQIYSTTTFLGGKESTKVPVLTLVTY